MVTEFVWPIRCARSLACRSAAGFHHGSKCTTVEARVKFRPYPPAFKLIRKTDGPAGLWNWSTSFCRSLLAPSSRRLSMERLFNSSSMSLSWVANWLKTSIFRDEASEPDTRSINRLILTERCSSGTARSSRISGENNAVSQQICRNRSNNVKNFMRIAESRARATKSNCAKPSSCTR